MIAVALAIALQATWPNDRPDNGWVWRGLSNNNGSILFTKPGPRPNTIWTRQELRQPDELKTLSTVTLVEADCTGRRSRTIQGTDYIGPNLTGKSETWTGQTWRYPVPDTIADAILSYACDQS